jgi:hypothetical protein
MATMISGQARFTDADGTAGVAEGDGVGGLDDQSGSRATLSEEGSRTSPASTYWFWASTGKVAPQAEQVLAAASSTLPHAGQGFR